MKKTLSVLLMATMIILTFAACGNKSEPENKAGNESEVKKESEESKKGEESKVNGKTYVFDSCTEGGKDATETIKAMYSEQSFEFKDGGVCVQTIVWADAMAETMGTDPVVQEGTYEENGDTVKVTFKVEGESDTAMEFTIDSDTIKLIESETTMLYKVKAAS